MEVDAGIPASSEYKIQRTHTDMANDSFSEKNEAMELRPATSTQGFTSVSLRVPSTDPLPSDDTSAIRLRIAGNMERPPGSSHAYNLLEPPNLASDRTGGGGGIGREERWGGVMADNRTNLREVTQTLSSNHQSETTGATTDQKKQQQLSVVMRLPLVKTASNLPHKAGKSEGDTTGGNLEGPHKYDEITELRDASGTKLVSTASKPHEYDTIEKNQSNIASKISIIASHTHEIVTLHQNPRKDRTDSADAFVNSGQKPSSQKKPFQDYDDVIKQTGTNEGKVSMDTRYDEPWAPKQQLPRRTTYSNNGIGLDDSKYNTALKDEGDGGNTDHSAVPPHPRTQSLMQSQKSMATHRELTDAFDDPKYDTAFVKETGSVKPPGKTDSHKGPPKMPPRVQRSPPPVQHADYKLTANFTTDEPEFMSLEDNPLVPQAHDLFDDPEYEVGLNLNK